MSRSTLRVSAINAEIRKAQAAAAAPATRVSAKAAAKDKAAAGSGRRAQGGR
ncbi:MAG: hypothetical protein HEQ37_16620 [Acidovorax sp.]|nr:hypothetical protein [Acidovorax sp.]